VWIWVELAVCMAVPFFFSGVIVSLALTRSPFPVGRVYGVDLLGAAFGCIGVIVILDYTDGPSAILWVAAIGAAASLFFAAPGAKSTTGADGRFPALLRFRRAILVTIAAAALINGLTFAGLQPLVVKGRFENIYTHMFREWNSFSRVAVFEEAKGVKP